MRFAVLLKGLLRGMGRETVCELLATKTVIPESSRSIYSHCAIIEAPADLPDGDYEVEFAGEVGITTLRSGSWMVGRILPHTYSEVAKFYARGTPQTGTRREKSSKSHPDRNPDQARSQQM